MNHSEAIGLKVFEDRKYPGDWRVEYEDDDGGCYVAVFTGPRCRAASAGLLSHFGGSRSVHGRKSSTERRELQSAWSKITTPYSEDGTGATRGRPLVDRTPDSTSTVRGGRFRRVARRAVAAYFR